MRKREQACLTKSRTLSRVSIGVTVRVFWIVLPNQLGEQGKCLKVSIKNWLLSLSPGRHSILPSHSSILVHLKYLRSMVDVSLLILTRLITQVDMDHSITTELRLIKQQEMDLIIQWTMPSSRMQQCTPLWFRLKSSTSSTKKRWIQCSPTRSGVEWTQRRKRIITSLKLSRGE